MIATIATVICLSAVAVVWVYAMIEFMVYTWNLFYEYF